MTFDDEGERGRDKFIFFRAVARVLKRGVRFREGG